jgi:hypothetical protein
MCCNDRIDPSNYTTDSRGFMCLPCGEDYYRYTTTAHDQELAA